MNYMKLLCCYGTSAGFLLVVLAAALLTDASVALAAELDANVLSGGDGMFNSNLKDFLSGMTVAAQIISTIMVALGGLMVATGQESGMKTVWNIMLGAGLAINIGSVLAGLYTPVDYGAGSRPDFHIKVDSSGIDSILAFPQIYHEYTLNGANAMIGPASKLLLVFTAISASIKISLDLISGDKVRYLVELLLQTGAYFFLILNWYGNHGLNIMGSLASGFEQLGYAAGGAGENLVSNNILGNMYTIIMEFFSKVSFDALSPLASLTSLILMLIIACLLALTGLEMFMARIEFWTLAMVTIPLVPFAAFPQTRFLFESALNCMINCAIKVCVIAFLTAMSADVLTDYVDTFTNAKDGSDLMGNFPLYIQALLVSFLLYLVVKKIPDLVTGLLSGRPNLGGSSMKEMAGRAANTAVQTGAVLATGGAGIAKGAAMGGASAAGGRQGFKAAGAALAGGINGAAGAAMSGIGGMAKASLLGDVKGSAGGGLLGGMVQSARTGAELGRNFASGRTATKHFSDIPDSIMQTFGSPEKMIPAYEPKTGKAIYEKDSNGNIIMGTDGKPRQAQVASGRHDGMIGNLKDAAADISSAYKFSGSNRKQ